MIEFALSTTAIAWCAWTMFQCRRNRREIGMESKRIEQLRQALLNHQMAPELHRPSPWDVPNPL